MPKLIEKGGERMLSPAEVWKRIKKIAEERGEKEISYEQLKSRVGIIEPYAFKAGIGSFTNSVIEAAKMEDNVEIHFKDNQFWVVLK